MGWIRPGSGSAWPDPACLAFFFFFFSVNSNLDGVLYFKSF
jgi:hypothetical protein